MAGQLKVNDEQRERGHLNLVPASEPEIEALVREVRILRRLHGPVAEECDFVLERFSDVNVLRGLKIHETLDGQRVRIEQHTYVDEGTFTDLPEEFGGKVTRIRPAGYARFAAADGTNRLIQTLSWESVIEIALDQSDPAKCWQAILVAIGHLDSLHPELQDRVRAAAWLPLADGATVKPSQVLDLPAQIRNSIISRPMFSAAGCRCCVWPTRFVGPTD